MKNLSIIFFTLFMSFYLHSSILIIDFGCPAVPLITHKIESLGQKTYIRPWHITKEEFNKLNPDGIVLSGGPGHIYQSYNPYIPQFMLESKKPILGICYGMQALSEQLGGKVISTHKPKKGPVSLLIDRHSTLFKHIEQNSTFWMSRSDKVEQLPPGATTIASALDCPIAAFSDEKQKLYAVQFHPEMSDTQGTILFSNFLDVVYRHALSPDDYKSKSERLRLHILLQKVKKLNRLIRLR